ncbi:MAG: protein translocase subunit SecD, partial [Magnetococcales bacterium]|nr:protein translocase subunit SecD [Magnetococcales bacterium]
MRRLPIWKPVLLGLVILVSLLFALPTLLVGYNVSLPSWMPDKVLHRGLDLQGGIYLLLHVESDKAVEQATDNFMSDIRLAIRESKQKLRFRKIERSGMDTVRIQLTDQSNPAQLVTVIKEALPRKNVRHDPTENAVLISLVLEEITEIRKWALDTSIQTIRSRIDQFGVSEPTIQRQGTERILVQLPGMDDPGRAKELIGKTARLEFRMVDEKGDVDRALKGYPVPGSQIFYGVAEVRANGQKVREPYLLKKSVALSGDMLKTARVNFDNQGA